MNRKIIILEDLDFMWSEEEIEVVIRAWHKGLSLKEINNLVQRQGAEVLMLLVHLSREKIIKKRDGYLWGKNNKM